jgi:TatD DNase family protein
MKASLVDIGANLTNKAFRADGEAVLSRAAVAGVGVILVTGTSAEGSRHAREMAAEARSAGGALPASGERRQAESSASRPRLFATAGVHPHHASTWSTGTRDEMRALLARPEVVAVGECGLDYNRNFSPPDAQRRCFEAQLELAAEVRKPVFLHEREATADFAEILERWRPRLPGGVVHCFTGDGAALERWLGLGMHVGITGWICDERRGAHLRELVRRVPRGRLLVETDAPYLIPRDMPGRPKDGRNEPAFLVHVARAVADHRGETLDELAAHTTATAQALFGLAAA